MKELNEFLKELLFEPIDLLKLNEIKLFDLYEDKRNWLGRIKFLKSHKISIENKMFELKQNFFGCYYRGKSNEIFEIKNKYSLVTDV